MRRRTPREQSVLSNPILIGALTVLATIAAVTLAYQANNGLPFVPKYHLNVQIRNASELTHGAEVHMGGALVGNVDDDHRRRATQGTADRAAQAEPQQDRPAAAGRFDVQRPAEGRDRPQVPGGHTRGPRRAHSPNGATVPVSQASAEVDLDQVLSMFDPKTAEGIRETTIGFSDALAGRGNGINNAIGAFVPLLRNLLPVATNLASRQTDLAGFFRGLESFSGAVAPVAQTQADLYVNLDTTFRALAPVAVPFLQNWISETPPTFQTVISDSPSRAGVPAQHSGSVLRAAARVSRRSTRARRCSPTRSRPARRTCRVRKELDARLLSLAKTAAEPTARRRRSTQGLDRITATVKSLRSPLAFLTPAQTTCNYVSLFLRNTASSLQEHFGNGTALRFQVVVVDDIPGSEAVPSSSPFLAVPAHSPANNGDSGPLHTNPYPNTAAPGETHECAAGNEPYTSGYLIGNPPGKLPATTEKTTRPKG